MSPILRNPVFLGLLVLFIWHQIVQKWYGLHHPLLDSFFDPLAGTALLASGLLWERQRGFTVERISMSELIALVILTIVVFECVVPIWHSGFTSDWMDVPFYSLGGLIFYLWINPAHKGQE